MGGGKGRKGEMRETGWIKCCDEMPPAGLGVVFWVEQNKFWESGHLSDEVWVCERTDGSDDTITYPLEQVSHWMRIEEPKEP